MRTAVLGDDRAVAPVVAEVLLVGMSVALAATVYAISFNLSTQNVPARPFITFAPATLDRGNATLQVAAASQSVDIGGYRLSLLVHDAVGTADIAASGLAASISIGGISYLITWTDISGNGRLVGGDVFTVTGAGVPLPAHASFRLSLLWGDGAAVASVSWTT